MKDIWILLAGLGIFIYGMRSLETAVHKLSGRKFRIWLKNFTNNRIKSVLAGTASTAILQSSSAVALITIAFVGAGVMTYSNAIGVILGSNLGTTFTSWLVAGIGFKFSIEMLALPLIALGGLGLIFFSKVERMVQLTSLLVSLGFVLMGLEYMKKGALDMVGSISLEAIQNQGLLVYVLAGFIITSIMQSSSASMALILTAVHSQILSFEDACAFVIGTNIGTTTTVIIATFGARTSMRRLALAHLIFNVVTACVALILFYPIIDLMHYFSWSEDLVIALAFFHSVFNLLGVLLFLPFLSFFARLIRRWIKRKLIQYSYFISQTPIDNIEAACNALTQELEVLMGIVAYHNLKVMQIDHTLILDPLKDNEQQNIEFPSSLSETYLKIKQIQAEVYNYASKTQSLALNSDEADFLFRITQATNYAVASSKTFKDYAHEFESLYQSDLEAFQIMYKYFRKEMMHIYMDCLNLKTISEPQEIHKRLFDLFQRLENEDLNFYASFVKKLQSSEIKPQQMNSVLAAQRGFNLANRQILLALRSLLLDKNELKNFETIQ